MGNPYSILKDAYRNYEKTHDRHFRVLPKDSDYLVYILNEIPDLLEQGYIENVTENLLDSTDSISIVQLEDMSFDITQSGIMFARSL